MARKHYKAIAATLAYEQASVNVCRALAEVLAEDNKRKVGQWEPRT